MKCDVVVVGSGAAGTAAALSAAETARASGGPIDVVIVDKAPEEAWGGNSRWTEANMRLQDEDSLAPGFEADLFEFSRGKSDPHIRTFVDHIGETIRWVRARGVEFERRPLGFGMAHALPRIGPNGGGLALIMALRSRAETLGAKILFGTGAWKLSLDGEGNLDGIWVRESGGRSRKISARAVILCCGGFEGNYEMLGHYVGGEAVSLRWDVPATPWNTGDGIVMALEVRAKTAGQFDGYHGSIADARPEARRRRARPIVNCWPYGILVNQSGRRFVDEGMAVVTDAFEDVSWAIRRQPYNSAFAILDQKFFAIPNHPRTLLTPLPPIRAGTIEELAGRIEVPGDALRATLDDYNRAVQPGAFDPEREDGKRTVGLEPPKSNWALPLDTPPFVCYPVEGTVQFTWGGLATDTRARVLATGDVPIPGLYAAGEIVGFYYYKYVGGTSVLRALTFGKIAGQDAARYVREQGPDVRPS